MKTNEIVEGGTYSNGKGNVRKIVVLDCPSPYRSITVGPYVQYDIIAGRKAPYWWAGKPLYCSLAAFASWAKERIS